MDKVQVLMATYNGEDFIKEQINSILNQTYKNFELLIRDDNSSDKTVEIIRGYIKKDNRIKLIEDNKGNIGINKNFELLINISNTKYIMISDQDDIWFKDKIERSLKKIKEIENDKPALVFSDSILYKNNCEFGNHIGKKFYKYNDSKFLMGINIAQGSTMIFNEKLKEKILPFNFYSDYLYDFYIFKNAKLYGNVYFIKNPTMYYRIHNKNQIGIGSDYLNIISKIRDEYYRYFIFYKKIKAGALFYSKTKEKYKRDMNKKIEVFTLIFLSNKNRFIKLYYYFKEKFFTYNFYINLFIVLNIFVNKFNKNLKGEDL
ncbi:rhamnosyltransferase [Hypnocyclicus thermotrophus]|uniref:Rhamnosyltransferase n=1 Tax=Hypnocyclicus thermotrophus TaxID=1627895 RepID=A0AA46I6E3_9FUSO|nr:glycosyltransferase family 2 protein [Hypnocyclicus thermotrophus]TDT72444.1 rhamnosyltransferase [Hypnocyclicus thermotrophus]